MKAERRSVARLVKPRLWSTLLLAASAIVSQRSLYAGSSEWANVGPEGGALWQLVVDPQNPDILYATTAAGLIKSQDAGASWNNAGLNGFLVYSLILDPHQPNVLYAAAFNSRQEEDTLVNIFKSTDGGDSWNESDSGLSGCCVDTLAIDPQNTGTLYALNRQGAALGLDPQDPDTVYAGGPGGLFTIRLATGANVTAGPERSHIHE
jgi:hypothetical protein